MNERIVELRAALAEAGFEGATASLIQELGEYLAYGPTTLAGQLLAELGFVRSELQSEAGDFGFITVAEELLPAETDADVVIAIAGGNGTDAASIFDSPAVDVGDTPSATVMAAWTGNHALAAWMILDDIEAIALGDGNVTNVDNVVDVWADLVAAIDAA